MIVMLPPRHQPIPSHDVNSDYHHEGNSTSGDKNRRIEQQEIHNNKQKPSLYRRARRRKSCLDTVDIAEHKATSIPEVKLEENIQPKEEIQQHRPQRASRRKSCLDTVDVVDHKATVSTGSKVKNRNPQDGNEVQLQRSLVFNKLPGTGYFSSNHILINDERKGNSLLPLTRLPELDKIAREHAVLMAKLDGLFYSIPDDLSSFSREYQDVGQNVAYGSSLREVHAMMMKSKSERSNILNSKFSNMGTGTARGKDGVLFVCYIFMEIN